ncbi:MAG: 4-hydroxythreonine-4-phosphate dehydrogenase PdxA [Sinomonas sp.]|nr:4-hydroxythreonine-4-phosphate dehydrogenase PdxA [Sinomonas sp.]
MTRLVIVADDLTGAADSAIGFASSESTAVLVDPSAEWPDADVLAVTTESRYLPADQARSFAQSAAHKARANGAVVVKKIDSLMRGNVGAEVAGILDAARGTGEPTIAVVAPAFPRTGRTTAGGVVHVDGAPLEGRGDIAGVLARAGLGSVVIRRADWSSPDLLAARLRDLLAEGADAAIVDAATDDDLADISEATAALSASAVVVGTGGIAAHLARRIGTAGEPAVDSPVAAGPGHPLAVIGSYSPTSRTQSARLVASGYAHIQLPGRGSSASAAETGPAVAAALGSSGVLLTPNLGEEVDKSRASLVAAALGEAVAHALPHASALIVSGGETAAAILARLGASVLWLRRELLPGVVATEIPGLSIPFVLKSGSFGDAEALCAVARAFEPAATTHPQSHTHAPAHHQRSLPVSRPIIAITMGDPVGIGPEIIAKSMNDPALHAQARVFVIGDLARLELAMGLVGSPLTTRRIESVDGALFDESSIDVLDVPGLDPDLPWGELSAQAGHAAYLYIEKAVELALAGSIDAICTAPLNKAALHLGGHKYPGHTELLAELTGTPEVSMMLTAPKMRVIHVTTHIGLVDAVAKIDGPLVYRTIRRGYDLLRRAGIENPHIGVAAINPHAGENGLFGYGEEAEKIQPGVEQAQAEGINAEGPLPADTLFFKAGRGDYDLVVAMYHDQGHGPVKVLGLENGVNITVGLPVVRTSVDHGTAFDIAGKNLADHASMLEAIRAAVGLAAERVEVAK